MASLASSPVAGQGRSVGATPVAPAQFGVSSGSPASLTHVRSSGASVTSAPSVQARTAKTTRAAAEAAQARQAAAPTLPPATPPRAAPGAQDVLFDYSQKLGQRITVLEAEVVQLREERDGLRTENAAISEHIFGLQKENGMLHDMGWTSYLEKAQLAKTAQGVSQESSQMKDTLRVQKERIEALTAETKHLQSSLEALKSEFAQKDMERHGLEVQLETVQADLTKRIGREGQMVEHRVALERRLEEVSGEKNWLDEAVSGQHVEIAKLQQTCKELIAEKARSHALAQKLQTSEMENARLRQESAELDSMVGTLHVEVAQLMTQRDTALTEVPHLQGSLRQQASTAADLQDQVRHLQGANHELQRQNANLEAEVKSLHLSLEELRGEASRHERSATALFAERTQLRHALEDSTNRHSEVDQRLNAVMGQKGIVHAHFEQVSADNAQLQMRVQQANSENAALRSRVTGLEKMVQGLQDETAGMHERIQVLRNEREELHEHVHQLQPHQAQQRLAIQGAL